MIRGDRRSLFFATPQSRWRQLPLRGAEKPLIEERCHEVTEWCMAYMEKMAEPPHSRRCRQLHSRGAIWKASHRGEVSRSDGVVAILHINIKMITTVYKCMNITVRQFQSCGCISRNGAIIRKFTVMQFPRRTDFTVR